MTNLRQRHCRPPAGHHRGLLLVVGRLLARLLGLGHLGSLGATGVRFVVRDAIVIAAVSKLFLRLVAVSR
jgi:hypothetical protein